MLLCDAKSGHAGGQPFKKIVEDSTDELTFVAWQLGVKYSRGKRERLVCALFENLVEISKIPLAFAGLYGPFDELQLWVGKGVIDPMFLTPTNEFPRRYRPSFKRGLRVPVIFALNLLTKIGERGLNGRHEFLDDLQISVYGKILRFVDDIPMKKAQHRAHGKGKTGYIGCRSLADFLSNKDCVVTKGSRTGFTRLKSSSGPEYRTVPSGFPISTG